MARTQADRRAASRAALLDAAARGISRAGYGQLVLADVAAEAGYTRGALYHQFRDKDALVLATLEWVMETWEAEVGTVFGEDLPPADAVAELARRHAVYCRRDIAGIMAMLRVEFAAREHPIGHAVRAQMSDLYRRLQALIEAGRADGSIPPGPAADVLAKACLASVEAVTMALAGEVPADEQLAARAVRGLVTPSGDADRAR